MLIVRRLVIAIRNNKPYHYWRECKEIDKFGMFQVQEGVKEGTYNITGAYILYKKGVVKDWNKVMDIIEALGIERLREKKLESILNGSSKG